MILCPIGRHTVCTNVGMRYMSSSSSSSSSFRTAGGLAALLCASALAGCSARADDDASSSDALSQKASVVASGLRAPRHLARVGSRSYFIVGDSIEAKQVMALDDSAKTPVQVGDGETEITDLAADSAGVYYIASDTVGVSSAPVSFKIVRRDPDGTNARVLYQETSADVTIANVRAQNGTIYFTRQTVSAGIDGNMFVTAVWQVDESGQSNATEIFSARDTMTDLAIVDAGFVWIGIDWSNPKLLSTVMFHPTDPGATTRALDSQEYPQNSLTLGGAGDLAFWSVANVDGKTLGAVVVASVSGKRPTVALQGEENPKAVTSDGEHVYWATWGDQAIRSFDVESSALGTIGKTTDVASSIVSIGGGVMVSTRSTMERVHAR
jgi:hypothetical protein